MSLNVHICLSQSMQLARLIWDQSMCRVSMSTLFLKWIRVSHMLEALLTCMLSAVRRRESVTQSIFYKSKKEASGCPYLYMLILTLVCFKFLLYVVTPPHLSSWVVWNSGSHTFARYWLSKTSLTLKVQDMTLDHWDGDDSVDQSGTGARPSIAEI